MRWFFRITGLIFLVFALLVGFSALLPQTQTIERSQVFDLSVETIFDTVVDLRTHSSWSHLVPESTALAYGQMSGTGASAVWRQQGSVGSIEIQQTIDSSLVLTSVHVGRASHVLTYVLAAEDTGTIVLLRSDRDLGGFPYLHRLRAKIGEARTAAQMDASLVRLGQVAKQTEN